MSGTKKPDAPATNGPDGDAMEWIGPPEHGGADGAARVRWRGRVWLVTLWPQEQPDGEGWHVDVVMEVQTRRAAPDRRRIWSFDVRESGALLPRAHVSRLGANARAAGEAFRDAWRARCFGVHVAARNARRALALERLIAQREYEIARACAELGRLAAAAPGRGAP